MTIFCIFNYIGLTSIINDDIIKKHKEANLC
uniref:Uncharacterized protein n=1 Tax=Siphoviridae sp. ctXZx16 TaxID=2826371 RepID=A0A8S5MKW9_9CAUD|nr:MAG TPA: hypothetical protein [Siphoviridae sp. ctXZx16]